MKYLKAVALIVFFVAGFIIGTFTNCAGLQLTKPSEVSKNIDQESSISSVLAECYRQNSKAGAGQNQAFCEPLRDLFINDTIYRICQKKDSKSCLEIFNKKH